MARGYYGEEDDAYDLVEDYADLEELEIPDVPWREDIEKIPRPSIKLKEICEAEKYQAEKNVLDKRFEDGEISLGAYDSILRPKRLKATTRCALASVDLIIDDLGDASEDYDLLTTGNLEKIEQKERLKNKIEAIGPDVAEELADRIHDEERLSDDTYERIKMQTRLAKRNGAK